MPTSVADAVRRLPAEAAQAPVWAVPGFPTRLRDAILRTRCAETIADLAYISDEQLLSLRSVGPGSVASLVRLLESVASGSAVLESAPLPNLVAAATARRSGPPAVSRFRSALEATIAAGRRYPGRATRMCILRLGLDGSRYTLAEVGERSGGGTRENVRQTVERTLKQLTKYPIAAAFRSIVTSALAERGVLTLQELARLSSWLEDLDEMGMRIVLEAFLPAVNVFYCERARGQLVSLRPRPDVESALNSALDRLDAMRSSERALTAVGPIAAEAAREAGDPRFAWTFADIARADIEMRRRTFSDFVQAYVEESTHPVALSEVAAAAAERGFSETNYEHVRQTIMVYTEVYPLGGSTFGTFAQIFPEPRPELDWIAVLTAHLVEQDPARQFHALELWNEIRDRLPDEAALVGGYHRLAVLLRVKTGLRYLGRYVFGSAQHGERIELIPLARRILEEAGAPLPAGVLVERMRRHRGFPPSSLQLVRQQLVEVRRGVWGLPGRDDPDPHESVVYASESD